MARAEKDQAPVAAADEFEAAEDESTHENFAELGVFGDERAEGVAGEFDEIAGFDGASANENAATGNHGEFAGEAAGTMDGDGAFAVEARLHNFHGAGKNDEERDVGVADIEKNFAAVDVPDVAPRANSIDLRWSESRENLRARIKRTGYRRCSHFFPFNPALRTGLIRVHSGQESRTAPDSELEERVYSHVASDISLRGLHKIIAPSPALSRRAA